MENENKLILVFYISVQNIDVDDIKETLTKITENMLKEFDAKIITIPVFSGESRVVCINPVFITDEELIKENTEMLKELNIKLKNIITVVNG